VKLADELSTPSSAAMSNGFRSAGQASRQVPSAGRTLPDGGREAPARSSASLFWVLRLRQTAPCQLSGRAGSTRS
jgi:hypothetical protein